MCIFILDVSILKYNGDDIGFSLNQLSNGKLSITLPERSATELVAGDSFEINRVFAMDSWVFVAIVYSFNDGMAHVYVHENDVTDVYDWNIGQRVLATVGDVRLGGGMEEAFEGGLSCVQIYDTAFSQEDVLANLMTCNVGKLMDCKLVTFYLLMYL